MYKTLLRQVLKISSEYANLLEKQIRQASSSKGISQDDFQNIIDGIRILHHSVVMLTKIDRLCAGENTDGQETL